MSPSILQINISSGGVPKRPVPQAVVTPRGIQGDLQAHPEVHGGPNKALLLITSEGLAELIQAGFPVFHGALGENLTTAGLDRRAVRLGQRYRIADTVLEVSKLREPCRTIQVYGPGIAKAVYDDRVQAGDYSSPLWGLGGFYLRVIQPGAIRAGDRIELLGEPAAASDQACSGC